MLRGRIDLPFVARRTLVAVIVLGGVGVIGPISGKARAQPVDPYQQPTPTPAQGPSPAEPAPAPRPSPAQPAPLPPPSAPQDPYSPGASAASPGSPAPGSGQDAVLAERVAAALVARAKELLDAHVFLDAKQLAVEALVQSPRGRSSEQARAIIHEVNQELGIPEDSPRPEPARPTDDVDLSPIQDPTTARAPVAPLPDVRDVRDVRDRGAGRGRLAARVHGGLYAGLVGATIGAFVSDDEPAAGAVPVGVAAGLAGGLVMPRLVDRLHWTEPQVRIVGSATTWGGVVGGLFGDIAKTEGTTGREVLVAATVGSTLVGLGGAALARNSRFTRGDVAMVDTFAGIGAIGGFTLGMAMQPIETEAYSLNSVLGITAGVAVAIVAAPQISATPRRMARVAGVSAVGAAAPFLLYGLMYSQDSTTDERITGVLSTAGLVVGAYLGFRWTRGMDEGLDTLGREGVRNRAADDAPAALVGRSSDGRWGLGGVGIQPLSRALAPQPGMALQVVGATF